ncbi:ribosome modulation factor [Burkholderia thailandensis]|uniref:ribosome modulation factor n=1 Tax=Burkholderia thailandensis TaxID=57975 RepID=UPI00217D9948|nr:ribosome modulation factor [Burkholderia thailandensis]MCS6496797.1 ribosome modulation factor [Burkholderia thailandensis]
MMLTDTFSSDQIKARQDGFAAGHEGRSQRSCPFDEATDLAQEWRCGWITGWHEQSSARAN